MNKSFLLAFVSIATYTSEPKSPRTPTLEAVHKKNKELRDKECRSLRYTALNSNISSQLENTTQSKVYGDPQLLESYTCPLGSQVNSDILVGNRYKRLTTCFIITSVGNKPFITPAHPSLFYAMKKKVKEQKMKNSLTPLSK